MTSFSFVPTLHKTNCGKYIFIIGEERSDHTEGGILPDIEERYGRTSSDTFKPVNHSDKRNNLKRNLRTDNISKAVKTSALYSVDRVGGWSMFVYQLHRFLSRITAFPAAGPVRFGIVSCIWVSLRETPPRGRTLGKNKINIKETKVETNQSKSESFGALPETKVRDISSDSYLQPFSTLVLSDS